MADFPIGIRNGILSGEHRRRIGGALWEYLWLIDHVTDEYTTAAGETRGRVLSGKVIEAVEIANEFADGEMRTVSPDTVRANLADLERAGYIIRRRARNGHQIEVRHSKKWTRQSPSFCPNASGSSSVENGRLGDSSDSTTGESDNRTIGENAKSPIVQVSKSPVASKDIAVERDITEDIARGGGKAPAGESTTGDDRSAEWLRSRRDLATQRLMGVGAINGDTTRALGAAEIIPGDRPGEIVLFEPDPPHRLTKATVLLLQQELRGVMGRPVTVTFIPHTEARAGP